MSTSLPARPNLEHLREQAKKLLSAYKTGERHAIDEYVAHLPAASSMTPDEVILARFPLADAQSVVARKHGFPSWPRLVHYVEELRALEGTWQFISLEVDGTQMPEGVFAQASLSMDGDRFRMKSVEGTYVGIFNVNVECHPHAIDIHFTEGPHTDEWSYGIYEFRRNELKICLGLTGALRPKVFSTRPGSNHALETLVRADGAVWNASEPEIAPDEEIEEGPPEFQGEWKPISIVMDGVDVPKDMLSVGLRKVAGNQTTVLFGGQLWMSAQTRIDVASEPGTIEYTLKSGPNQGKIQRGIWAWRAEELELCMGQPGGACPSEFSSTPGSGHTLSRWVRSK